MGKIECVPATIVAWLGDRVTTGAASQRPRLGQQRQLAPRKATITVERRRQQRVLLVTANGGQCPEEAGGAHPRESGSG
jgi:hypothetical protein